MLFRSMAKELGVKRILCYGVSDLVVQQLDGTWDTKSPTMAEYRRTVDEFSRCFAGLEVQHISQDDNDAADALAMIGSRYEEVPPDVFLHHLYKPCIKGCDEDYPWSAESVHVCLVTPDWTTPYINFLVNKELPKDDEVLSHEIERRAKAYTIINRQLYKRDRKSVV